VVVHYATSARAKAYGSTKTSSSEEHLNVVTTVAGDYEPMAGTTPRHLGWQQFSVNAGVGRTTFEDAFRTTTTGTSASAASSARSTPAERHDNSGRANNRGVLGFEGSLAPGFLPEKASEGCLFSYR
jgi:hypothetical protein